jgi:hypothetical protein
MLKLTYTEAGFHMELLTQSLEEWVQGRVILLLRVGQRLLVEPSTASFLLPADLPGLPLLQTAVELERTEAIALCVCDAEYVEVNLRGTWLAADSESAEGVFVTAMSDSPLSGDSYALRPCSANGSRTEFFIFKLWQEAQACTSSLMQ